MKDSNAALAADIYAYQGIALTAPIIGEWIYRYRELPGNGVGGNLHNVIEDENLKKRHIDWCRGWADAEGDRAGSALGSALRRVPKKVRRHAIQIARDIEIEQR